MFLHIHSIGQGRTEVQWAVSDQHAMLLHKCVVWYTLHHSQVLG